MDVGRVRRCGRFESWLSLRKIVRRNLGKGAGQYGEGDREVARCCWKRHRQDKW